MAMQYIYICTGWAIYSLCMSMSFDDDAILRVVILVVGSVADVHRFEGVINYSHPPPTPPLFRNRRITLHLFKIRRFLKRGGVGGGCEYFITPSKRCTSATLPTTKEGSTNCNYVFRNCKTWCPQLITIYYVVVVSNGSIMKRNKTFTIV